MKKKSEQNYLDNIPIKNENYKWEVDDQIVTIQMENKGFYNRIAQKCFGTPKVSYITLDEFGSFVWQQIDGKRNIYEIGQLVKKHFGKEVEPLYERLSKYFYNLNNTKFISFKERDKI
ncbi:MAG: PqqD family protein [Aminipila sp.]